jgi:hypothetical protein
MIRGGQADGYSPDLPDLCAVIGPRLVREVSVEPFGRVHCGFGGNGGHDMRAVEFPIAAPADWEDQLH